MSKTVIDLIRHGEPVGGRKYRGWGVDDPLTEKGWQQMWDAIGNQVPWKQIVTSPLLRCKAFAEDLSQKHNIAITVENDLEEVGFGDWEGKTPEEIIERNKAEFDAFYADPANNRPTGAEDLDVFSDRVVTVYRKIVSLYESQQSLVVAHAGVIRAVVAYVLDAPPASIYKLEIGNAGLTRIEINAQGPKLIFLNQARMPD